MVRIKHRYLLVNILYPEAGDFTVSKGGSNSNNVASQSLPAVVEFRRPAPADLNAGHLIRHVRQHIELLYGDYGAGMTGSGMAIKYFSPATSTFIIRCPRAHYRLVWSALTDMTSLPRTDAKEKRSQQQARSQSVSVSEQACVMRVVRVSGTIRKSEEEAIRRARADILRAQRQVAEKGGKGAGGTLDALLGGDQAGIAVDVQDVNMANDDDGEEDDYDDDEEEEDFGVPFDINGR